MARKTIFVSDLSGESLDEASAAKVAITCNGDRFELDVKTTEVEHLIAVAHKTKVRGRKKKAAAVA
jgi:hypothetical protein